MTDAIRLEGVGKRYWKLDQQAMLLRSLLPFARPQKTELWALRDINLSVAEGEVIGMIGRNGAGKTTFLRMLAGVTRPTEGTLTVRGRIAPLISVGVGFHQEMSGRENVYVNGMLLGLTQSQIEARFDDIVAFAELHEFIDTPVKFYSSGMYMRLGFSVAVHTDPQVFLVDEVLAVGDLAFQMKCLERMKEIRETGATIVLVSHSMHAIRLLCQRAIVIRRGQLAFDGNVDEAIGIHMRLIAAEGPADRTRDGSEEDVGIEVIDRSFIGEAGETASLRGNETARYRLRVRLLRDVDDPVFRFNIHSDAGVVVYAVQTPLVHVYESFRAGDELEVDLEFAARLMGGNYRITTYVTTHDGRDVLYVDEPGHTFLVDQRLWAWGIADLTGVVYVNGKPISEHRSFGLGGPER